MTLVVDTHGNTHLRRAHHINGCLIALEDFEHFAQETGSQEHAAALDLNGCDIVLGCNRLNLTKLSLVADSGAFGVRVHCVEKSHGNTCKLGRLNASGVENLGTEICQLGSFLEVELVNRIGLVNNTRVVVVHTVDICPYLYLVCINGCTNQ